MSKKRTPEEQEIIDVVARSRGREFAEKNAALILEQARALGELAEEEDDADRPFVVDNGSETKK